MVGLYETMAAIECIFLENMAGNVTEGLFFPDKKSSKLLVVVALAVSSRVHRHASPHKHQQRRHGSS